MAIVGRGLSALAFIGIMAACGSNGVSQPDHFAGRGETDWNDDPRGPDGIEIQHCRSVGVGERGLPDVDECEQG